MTPLKTNHGDTLSLTLDHYDATIQLHIAPNGGYAGDFAWIHVKEAKKLRKKLKKAIRKIRSEREARL